MYRFYECSIVWGKNESYKTTSKEINCVGIKTICEGCLHVRKTVGGKTQIVKKLRYKKKS